MKAVDTNILARVILNDDEQQTRAAGKILSTPTWVTMTVWLELGWVLGTRLKLDRAVVGEALSTILAIDTIQTADPDGIAWAIERYRQGADWADMLHLITARGTSDRFVTFDRGIASHAGDLSPVLVETLP